MPKLPDVLDYGARPSLRSNRVDSAGPSGEEIGDAVTQAGLVFAQAMGNKKEKDNRLQYALAKNEIMALDIAQRQGLKDREDFGAFDNDYTTGFNTGRDEILKRYNLSPDDMVILQSESDLIREKGRVYAGDLAKGIEVDQGRARISKTLDAALEAIQQEPPESQNELMFQALETVMAAQDDGWYTEVEAEALIQGFVSKAASNALLNMDTEQMIAEIEMSLAHRKARGAITREDIENELGSGSIADFLHASDLKEMLEKAKAKNETSTQYGVVYDIVDRAVAEYPGTTAEELGEREAWALSQLDPDDPEYGELRKKLQIEIDAKNGNDVALNARAQAEAAQEATNWIEDRVNSDPENPPTIGDLQNLSIWEDLSPQGKVTLENYVNQRASGHEYALTDDDDFDLEWARMTPEEKAASIDNFDSAEFKTKMTRDTWNTRLAMAQAQRDAKEKPGSLKPYSGDNADEMLDNVLIGEGRLFTRKPTSGRLLQRYRRIDKEVDDMLTALSMERIREGGTGEIFKVDKEAIIAQVTSEHIFLRQGTWGRTGDLATLRADVMSFDVTTDAQGRQIATNVKLQPEAAEAYIPYEDFANNASPFDHATENRKQTWEEYLRNLGAGADISNKDLEEAFFYLSFLPEETGRDYAARRLRGEKGL